jgi:hypothetical protein
MAGRTSLAYLGQEDIYLSYDPEVTYFVEKYRGHTLFSSRIIRLQFPGDVTFGSEQILTVPRIGDIVTNMYLKIIPPIQNYLVLDSAGTLMFQYIDLYIGSERIERLYGEHAEMMFDLKIPKGKQKALSKLIGKNNRPYSLVNTSYTVPLHFSIFNKGLPLCACNEEVSVRIVWNPSFMFTSPPIHVTIPFEAYIDTEYTYISEEEIDFIRSKPQVYLIEQVQSVEFFSPQGTNQFQCFTEFLNPVKELFFVIQNDTALGYDYTVNSSYPTNNSTVEQLQNLILDFNTTERISFDTGSSIFLRVIQPLEYHTRIPDRIFYMYSFSIDPEDTDPAGSVNMSLIKNQNYRFTFNTSSANRYIRIYAVSYNFLRISNSSAQIIFSNFK